MSGELKTDKGIVEVGHASYAGRGHGQNEDPYLVFSVITDTNPRSQKPTSTRVAAIAHVHSTTTSQDINLAVIQKIYAVFQAEPVIDISYQMSQALRALYGTSTSDPSQALIEPGIQSTVIMAAITDGILHLAWSGKPRAYLIRNDKAQPLLSIREDDAGLPVPDNCHLRRMPLLVDDAILVCSNGLTHTLSDADIQNEIRKGVNEELADRLIDIAQRQDENIKASAITLRWCANSVSRLSIASLFTAWPRAFILKLSSFQTVFSLFILAAVLAITVVVLMSTLQKQAITSTPAHVSSADDVEKLAVEEVNLPLNLTISRTAEHAAGAPLLKSTEIVSPTATDVLKPTGHSSAAITATIAPSATRFAHGVTPTNTVILESATIEPPSHSTRTTNEPQTVEQTNTPLPDPTTTPTVTKSVSPTPTATGTLSPTPTTTPSPTSLAEFYQIRPGDNLWAISRSLDLTIEQLLNSNPGISRASILRVGQRLSLPATPTPVPYISAYLESEPAHWIAPGQEFTYTIRYRNEGTDSLSNIVIQNTIPANTALIWNSFSSTQNDITVQERADGVITWSIASLRPQESGRLSYRAQRLVAPSSSSAQLSIALNGPPTATSDAPITFTLTVTNTSSTRVENLKVLNKLPRNARHLRGGEFDSGELTWTIDSLEAGEAHSESFVVSADSTLSFSNFYVLSGEEIGVRGSEIVMSTVDNLPPMYGDGVFLINEGVRVSWQQDGQSTETVSNRVRNPPFDRLLLPILFP